MARTIRDKWHHMDVFERAAEARAAMNLCSLVVDDAGLLGALTSGEMAELKRLLAVAVSALEERRDREGYSIAQ